MEFVQAVCSRFKSTIQDATLGLEIPPEGGSWLDVMRKEFTIPTNLDKGISVQLGLVEEHHT
jgi:hypothetical protein